MKADRRSAKCKPVRNTLAVLSALLFSVILVSSCGSARQKSQGIPEEIVERDPLPDSDPDLIIHSGSSCVELPIKITRSEYPYTEYPYTDADSIKMPGFRNGGLVDFREWLKMRIRYPQEALEKNITGRVTAAFIVEKDGSISNVEVLSQTNSLLNDAMIHAIRSSLKWRPGTMNGKPVRVRNTVTISFSLERTIRPILW